MNNPSRTLAARLFAAALLLASAGSALAAVRYVDVNSTNSTAPYTSWSTAATNIQDAVDAAEAGDEIVVTNGIYSTGGHVVSGAANRVAVDKPLTLRSVNGPQFTTIDGGHSNRCMYLTNWASLSGFTLTKGIAVWGAGVFCESTNAVVSNCVVSGNSAPFRSYDVDEPGPLGGGAYGGTLNNCILTNNRARGTGVFGSQIGSGGGACNATLNNCTVSGNVAASGGGVAFNCCGNFGRTLNNCALTGNSAEGGSGGAAFGGTLNNCTLTGNSAHSGGGAAGYYVSEGDGGGYVVVPVTLNNCTLIGNSADYNGGGAAGGTLNNCILSGNMADQGGGVSHDLDQVRVVAATLNNCTLTGNSAATRGGGAWDSRLNNCLVYFNAAPQSANYDSDFSTLNYSCTTPLPTNGVGNINNEPAFVNPVAGNYRLRADSPCIDAGTNLSASITHDLDGRPRPLDGNGDGLAAFDMGAYEYRTPLLVWQDSPNPTAPHADWATAAHTIQDAVDAAVAGDEIVVTNGIYATGGRVVGGATNRVAVDKPLSVRSVNGPQSTTIDGGQSVRCVYLTNGTGISGFTLTNGFAQYASEFAAYGGGLWCESTNAVVSNCVVSGNSTFYGGGGAYGGTLNNCTLSGNSGGYGAGGGAINSTLNNCTLSGNSAYLRGGGAYGGTLNNCTLSGNSARRIIGFPGNHERSYGGGAYGSTLNNCTLSKNSASAGGGAYGGTLNNCILSENQVQGFNSDIGYLSGSGGGSDNATLNNCRLTSNSADYGGGASGCTLNNCTLTDNSARYGGGAERCTLNNCIVYFNSAPQGTNYFFSTLNYSCTTPQPTSGVGNISSDPQLASVSHLSAASPCRGAGNAAYTSGTDIDGEPWASPPSIGCDEYHAGAVTGPLSVAIAASFTYVRMGFTVQLTALIEGRTAASSWDFGDGIAATNQPYAAHAWKGLGDYLVVLRAYNESQPGGISATVTVHVVAQSVHYVAADSANPAAPYTSWATAATNIQDAVDFSLAGDEIVVTNGIYAPIAADKLLRMRSVNGPLFTAIDGRGAARCVYLINSATLSGFTLAGGYALYYGGGALGGTLNNCRLSGNTVYYGDGDEYGGGAGAYGCILNNCTLSGNSARGSGALGGGAYGCTLNNCTLTGNSTWVYGGGASYSTLNNCTLTGNSAAYGGGGAAECILNNCTLTGNSAMFSGGGAWSSTLNNCIAYYNTSANGPNYESYGWNTLSTLHYSCTTPQPTNGVGNITNAPLFVDQASGNLRLQSNSPCINAGKNSYVTTATDLDGNPRIAGGMGGTVDIGAYEFQLPVSKISYAWLRQHALPIDGSADPTDPDGDGLNNWQEWRCATDPTNGLSALRMLAPAVVGSDLLVRWESVADRTYFLERSMAASTAFTPLSTDIPGQPGTTTYTETNAIGTGPWFYRVGIQE